MGTSFLSEVPEETASKAKSEVGTSYLSNHPLLTGAAAIRDGAGCSSDLRRGQYAEDDEDDRFVDNNRPPYGRPPPRRKHPSDYDYEDGDECRVRFGLHYASCFSKSKDFDDKL